MTNHAKIIAGIGLRGPHIPDLLTTLPNVDLLEVHSENFFGGGGPAIDNLVTARISYPISLHGVGLSLGSIDALSISHLAQMQRLIREIEPILVSEHLSWSSVDGVYFGDLLPLPYTEEALNHFCHRVDQVQDALDRTILIENPSSYLRYRHSTIPEWEFLTAISERTGSGILLDINNVYVSACNLGFDPSEYIASTPGEHVHEFHLGGHTIKTFPYGEMRIDDHASPVCDAVWELYAKSIARMGTKPTIIEWDAELPTLGELVFESETARYYLERRHVAA